ncbi:FAD-dependent oxidoreductase [Pseudactinotalea suaedae]|uniref:FAD-dependent oxidoreductase n=1 Tax=Pseudactinotalea suaedae TaxID=1524924 RepID=UPI0012E284FF|nr:NAD(P)/FAD-dependent oxidoreductase [Pseudactinotalea suaedae]
MGPLRVAVVGCGTAGPVAAIMLARAGHEVTVLEAAEDPGPVGAGIWLQALGQQVLDAIGLLEPLRAVSRPVARVDAVTVGGRQVMDFGYADVPGAVPAIGVHRGVLFTLLWEALAGSTARIATGVDVTGVRPTPGGASVETTSGAVGPFDLVIGADGSRSVVRESMRVAVRDHGYSYGALWALVDDPEGLAADVLYQCLDGTSRYLGVLPTGEQQASIFWSVRGADMRAVRGRGMDAWRQEAAPFVGERYAPLLDEVDQLLEAHYRDVVVRTPYRVRDGAGAVLIGDAAHAMSPQLGAGTSLALADAASLCHFLASAPDLETALAQHTASRRAHVRWYSWWTRLMMPVFQSDLHPIALPRDLLAGPVGSHPWVRTQMVKQLGGGQTGLVRRWQLPG